MMAAGAHVNLGQLARRQAFAGDHGAPGDLMPVKNGCSDAVQRSAGLRMQPVGAEEERGFDPCSPVSSVTTGRAAAQVDLRRCEREGEASRPASVRALEEQRDQVGAVQEVIALPGPQPGEVKPGHPIAGSDRRSAARLRPGSRRHRDRLLQPEGTQDTQAPFGEICRPAPTSRMASACSRTVTFAPRRASARAAARPATPAPMMVTALSDESSCQPPSDTTTPDPGPGVQLCMMSPGRRSVVAVDLLAAFMLFLRFQRHRRDRDAHQDA